MYSRWLMTDYLVTFVQQRLQIKMSIEKMVSSDVLKDAIIEGMSDLKAKDIVVIDLRKTDGAVTDFFVICHGDSNTHVSGITNSVKRSVLETVHQKPWHQEGGNNAEWILLDYVDVVTHVFMSEAREFYNVEELWSDAPITRIKE